MIFSLDSLVLAVIDVLYCLSFSVLLIFYRIITYTNLFSVCSCERLLMSNNRLFDDYPSLIYQLSVESPLRVSSGYCFYGPLIISIAYQIHFFGMLLVLKLY